MDSNPLFDLLVAVYKASQTITKDKLYDLFIHAPNYYIQWWISLLKESPLHLVIETGLCLFIVWIVFIRRTIDPTKSSKNPKLTKKEEEWLIETWQPDPIVPKLNMKEQRISNSILV